MHKFLNYLMACAVFYGPTALAQVAQDLEQKTTEIEVETTETTIGEISRGVYDSPLNLSGRAGILGFSDSSGGYTSRATEGFTFNWSPSANMFNLTNSKMGIESGILFSHLGSLGSNFFGTNAPSSVNAGSNSFMVPLNLAMGYRLTDRLVATGLVGTSMFYRSTGNSMLFGRSGDLTSGSSVDFFPSVGLNLGWEVSNGLALALRADYIPTSGPDMFTTTLGATFPLV